MILAYAYNFILRIALDTKDTNQGISRLVKEASLKSMN